MGFPSFLKKRVLGAIALPAMIASRDPQNPNTDMQSYQLSLTISLAA
jgi:hypothetical protein